MGSLSNRKDGDSVAAYVTLTEMRNVVVHMIVVYLQPRDPAVAEVLRKNSKAMPFYQVVGATPICSRTECRFGKDMFADRIL